MARKNFIKTPSRSTFSIHVYLSIKHGSDESASQSIAPTTTTDYIDLYTALAGVSIGIANLLAIENGVSMKAMSNRFKQVNPQIEGAGLRLCVELPTHRGRTKNPFTAESTLQRLKLQSSAIALSDVGIGDPAKPHLLNINEAVEKHGVEVRVSFRDQHIDLRDLGLADRTLAGNTWNDEVVVLLTEAHYRSRHFMATTESKMTVQLLLGNDRRRFNRLHKLGHACLRVRGRGFIKDSFLKIIQVHWWEMISIEEYQSGILFHRNDENKNDRF